MTYIENNNYRKPFIFALALHIALLIILLTHFKFLPKPNPVVQNFPSVIKAVAITPNQLQNQIAKLQAVQQAQLHEQQVQQQAQQQQKLAQEQQATQQRVAQEQAKKEAALKLQQQKAKEEQKLLAQQAIQQALQQQEQQTDQIKQKQEQAKQIQAAKLAAQQLLQQQLAATDPLSTKLTQSAALSAAAQGQIDKYSAMIISAIGQQWIIPDSSQKDLQGRMQVKVAPGGMVLNVTITQSSGDAVFDRSARAAVFKASPLPVPKDPILFNQFRILNLTFKPEGISNN